MSTTPRVGDTVTGTAVNGHRMVYTVRAIDPDGHPVLSQWDADHADTCPCHTAEDAEPLPTY
jgi:hypothetical protein